ncbi:DUF4239 domain-containing protein [Cyanobium sp. Morenito 9A2]|uniref:bestrophin-like domain n=1 Tax=Cyanobium sp. Morenito 9A2 TaxID=2823718 RepID=UPI0020CCE2EC|nr:DUF4239 domain-containing protein [Cyanobium sp. Morenito 9A2]MCP9850658.1 DUF4239 domain-containing protein [Cyanobium sp. Morenito 9A2]
MLLFINQLFPFLVGVIRIYGIALVLVFLALKLVSFLRRRKLLSDQFDPIMLGPLASIFGLVTAFLLSNAFIHVLELNSTATAEAVTLNRLGAIVSVLPEEQRVEARRLVYDYADSIAESESKTMRSGQRSPETSLALDELQLFFSSKNANLPKGIEESPAATLYQQKSAEILYNIIDAREKRLSQAKPNFQSILWLAVIVLYFAIAVLLFSTARGGWRHRINGGALLLALPLPALFLDLFSNPFTSGLIQTEQVFRSLFERNI